MQNQKFLAKDPVPESHLNPLTRPIDPFGNDYTCKICNRELANTYFHCEGCEELIKKGYNICDKCFTEERFKCNTAMKDEKLKELASNLHHIGKVPRECKDCRRKMAFPECEICKLCTWCKCRCHWNFSKHYRFFNPRDLLELKVNCEALVGDDEVQFAKETECRLGNRRLGQWVCKADKADLPLCYDLTPSDDDNNVDEV